MKEKILSGQIWVLESGIALLPCDHQDTGSVLYGHCASFEQHVKNDPLSVKIVSITNFRQSLWKLYGLFSICTQAHIKLFLR